MSNLLFVKRQGNGDLQYCVPQGYEWAIEDAHTRPRPSQASSKHHLHKQQEKTQKRWSLGPWQHVKLHPRATPSTPNPLHNHESRVNYHANAPFCSIVFNTSPLPTTLKVKPPTYTSPLDKQQLHILNEKAKMKARFSTVLPIVALSKNGEWVPQALGRKMYARLARHCSGGWSKRWVSCLDGTRIKQETPDRADAKSTDQESQLFSLDKPELNSSALLLQKLHIAEEELKHAQISIRRALAHVGCDSQGILNIENHHASRGSNGATFQHDGRGTQNHHGAPNESKDECGLSVRASCAGR